MELMPAHPLDSYGQWFLLEIAESANPPESVSSDSDEWCSDVVLEARDGWKVVFFYDCETLDYIDSFITPEGKVLEVWKDIPDSEIWPPLLCWRSVGDLARLKQHFISG